MLDEDLGKSARSILPWHLSKSVTPMAYFLQTEEWHEMRGGTPWKNLPWSISQISNPFKLQIFVITLDSTILYDSPTVFLDAPHTNDMKVMALVPHGVRVSTLSGETLSGESDEIFV